MPKLGIEAQPKAELFQQLQIARLKLQRIVKKHHKIAQSSPQK
jgi:ribonuclease P protein component